jgi:hypothetical protein
METTRTDFDVVAKQHEEINEIIDDLKQFLTRPRPEVGQQGFHTWSTGLSEKLLHLHDKLFRHFRDEERSGFLGELSRSFPRASSAIDGLRKEHDWIVRDLGTLLSACIVYSSGRSPENPQLRRWTQSLLDRLAEHEREETDLYQRLQYEDLGVGD